MHGEWADRRRNRASLRITGRVCAAPGARALSLAGRSAWCGDSAGGGLRGAPLATSLRWRTADCLTWSRRGSNPQTDHLPRGSRGFREGNINTLVIVVALAASFIPALRAARTDPRVALQAD